MRKSIGASPVNCGRDIGRQDIRKIGVHFGPCAFQLSKAIFIICRDGVPIDNNAVCEICSYDCGPIRIGGP